MIPRPNPYICIPVRRKKPQEAHTLSHSHSFSFLNFIYLCVHEHMVQCGGGGGEDGFRSCCSSSVGPGSQSAVLHTQCLIPNQRVGPRSYFFFVVLFCLKQLLITQADLKFDLYLGVLALLFLLLPSNSAVIKGEFQSCLGHR